MADKTIPQSRASRNDLTAAYVRSILDYDPETGWFRWKWRDDLRRCDNARCAGNVAGAQDGNGYHRIRIDGRRYKAHRLAWLIVTGAWPAEQIDHRNGVRDDNRVANLREATNRENGRNGRLPRNNTSGFKGVSWHRQSRRWQAYIMIDYHIHHLGL